VRGRVDGSGGMQAGVTWLVVPALCAHYRGRLPTLAWARWARMDVYRHQDDPFPPLSAPDNSHTPPPRPPGG
jgi:hypothetical protein